MRKTYGITIILCLLLACGLLISCVPKTTFEDITITGDNVSNLSEGTYTLRYNIENLDKFAKKHDYSLTVTVTDKQNKQITVENKRVIQVQADNEYYVNILLTADDKRKTHNYTVSSIKNAVSITFTAANYKNFENITRTVPYGGTLTDIPEVPTYTPPAMAGHTGIVTSAEWDIKVYTNLTQSITVKAVYTLKYTTNEYTITYHTDGGTEIPAETLIYDSELSDPTQPSKDGFVFFDWYSDAEFKTRFSFTPTKLIKKDLNLYVRWITPNGADESYFTFSENSDGKYYTVQAKNKPNMPVDLELPNTHNGKAVTKIADSGFAQCTQIKNVTIPETIDEVGTFAFSAKTPLVDAVVMSLETVTFSETYYLVTIGDSAFAYCKNLTSINIPDSVTHIEKNAFRGCSSLNTLTISDNSNLMQISDDAFRDCSNLVNVVLPKNVTRLSYNAFYNCTMLASLTLNCDKAPALEREALSFVDSDDSIKKLNLTIYVPAALLSTYQHLEVYDGYSLETIA